MRLKISHTTHYTYDAPVAYGLQQVRVMPVHTQHQSIAHWRVDVSGGRKELMFHDQYQNQTLLIQADAGVCDLSFQVSGEIETHSSDGIFGKRPEKAPVRLFLQETARTRAGAGIIALSAPFLGRRDTLSALHELSATILEVVPYGVGHTQVNTVAEEALGARTGVCQDHTQIFIAAARVLGIPARYVSGYLMMDDRVEQDASHAWAEAYVDTLGWVGFDISNGISPDERYVRLAVGRDSREAAPVNGLRLGAGGESMIVSLQIQQ